MKLAHFCDAIGMEVQVHTSGPMHRHCMAAIVNTHFYELALVRPGAWNIMQPPIYADDYGDQLDDVGADGCVPVPDGPGLSVAYDWDRINAWETAREVYDFRTLPERLREEGLLKRWKNATAAGDGNTMTQVFGMLAAIRRRDSGDAMTTNFKDPGDEKPNIFDFATKELSQDAMICWLIRWAGVKNADTDEARALKGLGRNFVDAMLTKHGRSLSCEILASRFHRALFGFNPLPSPKQGEICGQ